MDITILYEDAHLVVCIKPRGVLSQSDSRGNPAMPELLAEKCGGEIFPIHRLDREVSGVMVYAKTKRAAAGLSQLVGDHDIFVKHYYAVLEGTPEAESGTLEDLLFHDRFKNKTYVVDRMRGNVKHAKLTYRILATLEHEGRPLTLVDIRLHTGRTHQIRVQFASRNLPLAGDKKYGAKTNGDIALFSHGLSFPHPITKRPLEHNILPPEEGIWQLFPACDLP